jgi:hypothetical protein
VIFLADNKKGDFVIQERKKKHEIITEGKKHVDIPDVDEEEKKALDQTGDDATSGW